MDNHAHTYRIQNINEYIEHLNRCNIDTFENLNISFLDFLRKIDIIKFRHIENLSLSFDYPVTIIAGNNKIGKTSLLLLIACSHEQFKHYDSTTPTTTFRKFTWRDVISFTSAETDNGGYSYKLKWRKGTENKTGIGKRGTGKRSWTGLGKSSRDNRLNAKIKDREVRLIDLDRIYPARSASRSLNTKASRAPKTELSHDIVTLYCYVLQLDLSHIKIYQTGSHINKRVFLVEYSQNDSTKAYSSFNDASGEESLLNMLVDIDEAGNNSLILIDEIECGFHPETQRRLAKAILYLSWTKKQQFIITTHSATLMSAFPQKARKFIERFNGLYNVISGPAVNLVYSKMDTISHPLIRLYCEDDIAKYIINKLLVNINQEYVYFSRLINVVDVGAACVVKEYYKKHKSIFPKMCPKQGYACVYDGDYYDNSDYNYVNQENDDFIFFLFPHCAPEKFLLESYLDENYNELLKNATEFENHHILFEKMVEFGLAISKQDALDKCWTSFENTENYSILNTHFKQFIQNTIDYFSRSVD